MQRQWQHEEHAIQAKRLPRMIVMFYRNDGKLCPSEIEQLYQQARRVSRGARRIVISKRAAAHIERTGDLNKNVATEIRDFLRHGDDEDGPTTLTGEIVRASVTSQVTEAQAATNQQR